MIETLIRVKDLFLKVYPQLWQASQITLAIAFFASLLGFAGGTLLAIAQNRSRFFSWLVNAYVTIIRGTPMLLQIVFWSLIFSQISAFPVAIFAIGLNSIAYISQIIRAGIKSVSKGQIEAAKTLGISSFDTTRFIILPQALRVVAPALGNEFITLIKDSSLASLIGVTELYQRGNIIRSQTHDAIATYIIIACVYLLMTSTLSLLVYIMEKRLNQYARN